MTVVKEQVTRLHSVLQQSLHPNVVVSTLYTLRWLHTSGATHLWWLNDHKATSSHDIIITLSLRRLELEVEMFWHYYRGNNVLLIILKTHMYMHIHIHLHSNNDGNIRYY